MTFTVTNIFLAWNIMKYHHFHKIFIYTYKCQYVRVTKKNIEKMYVSSSFVKKISPTEAQRAIVLSLFRLSGVRERAVLNFWFNLICFILVKFSSKYMSSICLCAGDLHVNQITWDSLCSQIRWKFLVAYGQ